ncbi:MAG: hypothetical protein AB9819_04390 [Methanomassiliicoccales archaeon]
MDREGVGGFLESILAVMIVITASSVFLVVLASGTLQMEDDIDKGEVVSWLKANGLYSENGVIPLDEQNEHLDGSGLPDDISGMTIVYRCSGNSTPFLVLNKGEPPQGDVSAFQLPLLIDVDGRAVAGVVEVRTWR